MNCPSPAYLSLFMAAFMANGGRPTVSTYEITRAAKHAAMNGQRASTAGTHFAMEC